MTGAEERLIRRLAGELRPVRPLRPGVRALVWLGVVAGAALVMGGFADLAGLRQRLAMAPDLTWAAAGALLTAACAGIAAFQASVPGRSFAWMLLPLPPAALWLGASGWGCLRGWSPPGTHPATAHEAMGCAAFILALSLPLSALLLVLLRRAVPLQPGRVAALGGLAAGAAAASLLALFHAEDASAVDLLVHGAAVGLVILANEAWSRLPGRATSL